MGLSAARATGSAFLDASAFPVGELIEVNGKHKFSPDKEYAIVRILRTFDTEPNDGLNGSLDISVELRKIP